MANLEFGDVLLIGAVATVGFTLVSFGVSGLISRRGWSLQLKGKPPRRDAPEAAAGPAKRSADRTK